MNQQQWFGIVRALLAWLGGTLVGHGVITENGWTLIAGVLSTTAVAGYAFFVVHALTLDATLGVARAVIAAAGGLLIAKGVASTNDIETFSAFALLAIPSVWSAYAHRVAGLVDNEGQTSKGTPPSAACVALFVLALPILLSLGGCDSATAVAGRSAGAPATADAGGAGGFFSGIGGILAGERENARAALSAACDAYPVAAAAFELLAADPNVKLSASVRAEEQAAVAALAALCASPPSNVASAIKGAASAYSAVLHALAKAREAAPAGAG